MKEKPTKNYITKFVAGNFVIPSGIVLHFSGQCTSYGCSCAAVVCWVLSGTFVSYLFHILEGEVCKCVMRKLVFCFFHLFMMASRFE